MEQMRAVLHDGPCDGQEVAVEKGTTEIKMYMRDPRTLSRDFEPHEQLPIRFAIYRQRRTEPEYKHVFDFMGVRRDPE